MIQKKTDPILSIEFLWNKYGDVFKNKVKVRNLRHFNLKEHQEIIDNYSKYSKSKVKYRNIHIYDFIVLRRKTIKEAEKQFNIKSCGSIIHKVINKGFYKDLLKHWIFKYNHNYNIIYKFNDKTKKHIPISDYNFEGIL